MVKDSYSAVDNTLDCLYLQQLLERVVGISAAQKVMKSLLGDAKVTVGVAPKLLLDAIQHSDLGLTAKQGECLQAAIELGKSLFLPSVQSGEKLDSPIVASQILNRLIGFESVEKFVVLVLDTKHRLAASQIISSGTATETLAHPRELFGAVIRLRGTRCLVGHNHPSGEVSASPEDLTLTEQILQGGQCLGIPVLDHIIVGQGRFTSLRQTASHLWDRFPQGN